MPINRLYLWHAPSINNSVSILTLTPLKLAQVKSNVPMPLIHQGGYKQLLNSRQLNKKEWIPNWLPTFVCTRQVHAFLWWSRLAWAMCAMLYLPCFFQLDLSAIFTTSIEVLDTDLDGSYTSLSSIHPHSSRCTRFTFNHLSSFQLIFISCLRPNREVEPASTAQ